MATSPFRHLPPIPAMRAFEAAARHMNFTRAAEELGLTQSAISHQIRSLEDQMGLQLFLRQPRQPKLTAEGQRLAEAVRDGLGRIAGVVQALREVKDDRTLTVSLLPGFAVKWLFPRLIRFDERHPDIQINVATSALPVDFATGEADVAIRYGTGRYPGLFVERLLEDDMFPVCAPKLVRGPKALKQPADLAHHVLLHDDIQPLGGIQPGWRMWLDAAGVTGVDASRGRRFGQANMVLQAAADGLGVALGRTALVEDDLAAGRLVRPFGPSVPSGYAYYFVCPQRALQQAKVAAFRTWLREECGRKRGR
ncbi:MAG: transcriptional regulator GcvA [Alphaproteobacteria bacterium]|nr:transcriptional regulator GcvA [Alphaproteobacteria bacterium]